MTSGKAENTKICLECGAAVTLQQYEENAGHCQRCRFNLEQAAAVKYEANLSVESVLQLARDYIAEHQIEHVAPRSALYQNGGWSVYLEFVDLGAGVQMDPAGCFMLIDDGSGAVIDIPAVL